MNTMLQSYASLSGGAESASSNLQSGKEGLKGIYPGVHDLTAAHVHINIEGWVSLAFVTRLSPGKNTEAEKVSQCVTPLSEVVKDLPFSVISGC